MKIFDVEKQNIAYSEFMSIALVTQYIKSMSNIVICGLSGLQYIFPGKPPPPKKRTVRFTEKNY